MAKKEKINKTKEVATYLKAHPKAMATEISQALGKKGVKISPAHVANIKSKLKRMQHTRKTKSTASAPETPAVIEPATTQSNGSLTVLHVRVVAETVKDIGGFSRLKELLEVIREVGGLKKFKDLLEAMAVTEKTVVKS